MIRNFGDVSGLTNQPQGLDVGIPAGGGGVKSIQTGVTTIAASTTTSTVTISNIDVNKSELRMTFTPSQASGFASVMVLAKIVNGTTIQFERSGPGSSTITINWEVVEYVTVKSLQSGQTTITSGTSGQLNAANITVATVNPSRCMIIASMKNPSSATTVTPANGSVRWEVVSATQIRVYAYWENTTTTTIEWRLIEFP